MFPGAAPREQLGTRLVDYLREVDASRRMVELLLAQFNQPGLVVGCRAGDIVLLAHDCLQCCAGCGAIACDPGSGD
jgi:hypothetical protein